jgi:hypothetical protein
MNTLSWLRLTPAGWMVALVSLSTLNAQTIQSWTGATSGLVSDPSNWTNQPAFDEDNFQISVATTNYQLFDVGASNKTIDWELRNFFPYGSYASVTNPLPTITRTSNAWGNDRVSWYVGGGYVFNNFNRIQINNISVSGFAGNNTLNGSFLGLTTTGIRQASGGTLTVNGNATAGSLILDGAGNFAVSGNIISGGDLAIDSTGTVSSGGILGSGASNSLLIRSGATVRSATTGTISGATAGSASRAITNGNLFVNGTAGATLAWNVNGGTLGGAGSINEATAMNIGTASAGRLFSGDTTIAGGLDGLTINNSVVTLGANGTLDVRFNLDGSGVSTLVLANNTSFNITSGATLAITGPDVGSFTTGFVVDLVTASSGASITGTFTQVTYNNVALGPDWTLTQTSSGISLAVTPVPEPAAIVALAGLSAFGYTVCRRRHRGSRRISPPLCLPS